MSNAPKEQEIEPAIWPWVAPLIMVMVLLTIGSRFSNGQFEEIVPVRYLILIAVVVVSCGALMFRSRNTYLSHFKFELGWSWLPVGVIGFLVWIGLCHLELEKAIVGSLGFSTEWMTAREAFDPVSGFDNSVLLVMFLIARFSLLAVIIPLAEEFLLRGFLMRYANQTDWWATQLNQLKWYVWFVAPVYAVISHPPSEALAAIVWFSMVTWLMVRRNSIWPCVMVHATTNLLLGIYVVSFQQWQMW